jgi:hypothetical protein
MWLRAEMARFTCCRAANVGDRKERRVMAHTDKQKTSPLRESAGNQVAARDRRAVRTEDLSEEEIAAVEASEMGPGFEHLDAELDPGRGVCGRCCRRLRPKTSGARRCRQGTAGRQGVSRQPVRRFLTTIPLRCELPAPKSTGRAGDFVFRKGKAPQHGGLSGRSGAQTTRCPGL